MSNILATADAQAALPEIVLAVAALVLLMLGVLRDRSESFDRHVHVLAVVAAGRCRGPRDRGDPGRVTAFHGSLRRRHLRPLHEGPGAVRLGRGASSCRIGVMRDGQARPVRISGADPAGDARHDGDDLGQRPDRALYRVSSCSRWRSMSWRRSTATMSRSTEAGPEIFRSRRAVVGHAALWRVADLRLYRGHRLRRPWPSRSRSMAPASA